MPGLLFCGAAVLILAAAACQSDPATIPCSNWEIAFNGTVPERVAWNDFRSVSPNFTPQWTPDGSRIVFATSRRPFGGTPNGQIYVTASDGGGLLLAADGESEAFYRIAHSPSISPTGARVVYSTLDGSLYEGAGFAYGSYAIETSALNGSDRMTLTEGDVMDFAPAWSPNGPQIAFVRRYDRARFIRDECGDFRRLGIYTVRDNGRDTRKVVDIPSRSGEGIPGEGTPEEWDAWYHSGPVWSPDGQLLAYVVNERERAAGEERPGYWTDYYRRTHTTLYTVNADGSDVKRLLTFSNRGKLSTSDQTYVTTDEELRSTGLFSEEPFRSIVSQPAWSSDGQRIAFVGVSEAYPELHTAGDPKLYTVGRNGSDLREVVTLDGPAVANPHELWKWIETNLRQTSSTVFWSRDDSQIQFSWGRRMYFVNVDGSDLHSIAGGDYSSPSPDGSRVAHLREPWGQAALYTAALDGSDARALTSAGEDFALQGVGPAAEAPSCSAGVVVPDAEANPGLVRDARPLWRSWTGLRSQGSIGTQTRPSPSGRE